MEISKITKYNNCDILIGWYYCNVAPLGFDKTKTIGEMIDMAIENNCPIIIKNGNNGKWYLKGQGKTIEYLKEQINENIGNHRDGVYCLLIE